VCSVRGCGRPLQRLALRWICDGGHSYDLARSGYINLLQPQDRRSLSAGDSKDTVQARARLIAAGLGRELIEAIASRVCALAPGADRVVVDLGSGTGDTLGSIITRGEGIGVGIDLSAAAVDAAARRCPAVTWVVANADRRLPLASDSVDAVLSLFGRRNPLESARVLRTTGVLIVATPGPDDLCELRQAVQGQASDRGRVDALVDAHPMFTLVDRFQVRSSVVFDRDRLRDLLATTYRGQRRSMDAKLASLDCLQVTNSAEVVIFKR
jgi:23S rRNA (guanine745-N1)-methyltransferase